MRESVEPGRTPPPPPGAERSDPLPVAMRIVSGRPTPEELAALVAVLAGRSRTRPQPPTLVPSAWSSPSRRMRQTLRAGPDSWRRTALPR